MIIGDAPTDAEEAIERALTRQHEKAVSELLKEAAWRAGKPLEWAYVPVTFCRGQEGGVSRPPRLAEILRCSSNVAQVAQEFGPDVVILSGDQAVAGYAKEYPEHAVIPALRVVLRYPGLWANAVQTITDAVRRARS